MDDTSNEDKRSKLTLIHGGKRYRVQRTRHKPNVDRALTKRQLEFAKLVAEGVPASEAYRQAYGSQTARQSTMAVRARELAAKPHVANMIGKLANKMEGMALNNGVALRAFILERLHVEATQATTDAARIKALELLGKAEHVGLFRERIAQEQDTRTPDEIRAELYAKLKTAFAE